MPASQPLTIVLTVLGTLAVGVPVASFAQATAATPTIAMAPLADAAATLAVAPTPGPVAENQVAVAKLKITGLDAGGTFTAQHNPEQIIVDKAVPWKKASMLTGDRPELTFSSGEGRTMTFELVFDGVASNTDVEETYIAKLTKLASIIDASAVAPEDKKRPSRVKVAWGEGLAFEGVIEALDVKYTKFANNGTPVKATAKLKIKESSRASFKRP